MPSSSKAALFTPAILLTSLAVGLYWVSLYLYVPTLPVYAQTKTTNLALIGTVLAQYGLWQAIVRFPLGILSDWLGRRRPFIYLGFFLAGLGAWLMGSASSIQGVLVGRAVTDYSYAPVFLVMGLLHPAAFLMIRMFRPGRDTHAETSRSRSNMPR